MSEKLIKNLLGALVFLLALVTYLLTVQPSVPFWDTGEFSAAAIWQQVPHPPGAPLFLLIGKIFHVIIPFGDPAWRVNLVSVFSSAFIVWFLYLITAKVIIFSRRTPLEEIKGKMTITFKDMVKPITTTSEALAIYGASFIGAAALIYSDTFWFNAVESEVYAMSTLFVAIIFYLMMKWNEHADEPGHEKYLLLIMYLVGLSTGVHLLAILTLFSVIYFIYYRKYALSNTKFVITGIISVVVFGIIYPGIVKWIPALLAGHSPMRNEVREYLIEDSTFLIVLTVAFLLGLAYLFYYSYKNNNKLLSFASASILLVLLGYTTYTQILIRSNANPPMNENEPKTLTRLTSYLGREQYGDDPMWPRRVKTDEYYTRFYTQKDVSGNYIYGEWYAPTRKTVEKNDGTLVTIPEFTRVNFWGEMAYLWKYQINDMYFRYLFWNYVGKKSDVQDAESTAFFDYKGVEELNFGSGYADEFPVRFFALPLLFGLIGFVFHFSKDKKTAFVYLIAFLMMGVLAAIAQQQQDPQPRERDYFYTGSFLVWCMWIGIGAYAIIDWVASKKKSQVITAAVLMVSFIAVPLNMAIGGWKIHSRAGNYIPFDYSYNILQSTEKNSIIFTNGDNDTFPLWYLQDVAGVRRDVRIVNLSLANTLWYVDQLKNRQPWGTEKIPLTFSDESLQVDDETDPLALSYDFGEPKVVTIPVDREILRKYTDDESVINQGTMTFTYSGKPYQQVDNKMIHLFRVQDKVVLDILQQTQFKRPVYFSTTVGGDNYIGLDNFLRYEGMAMRICPVPQRKGQAEPVNEEIMRQCLFNIDNSDNYHKEPHYGFKFRNLNNMDVYYDEVHRRLMNSYRHLYLLYANYLMEQNNDYAQAVEAMDKMNEYISYRQFPFSFDIAYRIAKVYDEAGEDEKAREYADAGLESAMAIIENPNLMPDIVNYEIFGRNIGPYRIAAMLYEVKGDYKDAIDVMMRLLSRVETQMQLYKANPSAADEFRRLAYNSYDIRTSIDEYTISELHAKGDTQAALDTAQALYNKYMASEDPNERQLAAYVMQKIRELNSLVGTQGQAESDTVAK